MPRYAALLRGINVGGNKKVPMADLKKLFEKLGFTNVKTLLNSGNALFASDEKKAALHGKIEKAMAEKFGFPIPLILRTVDELKALAESEPFKGITVTPATRLYITFLGEGSKKSSLKAPFESEDGACRILRISPTEVCSVLTLAEDVGTVDAMGIIEREFGKNVTTRNWNTVQKMLR